ncbi:MAG: hypothetical protein M1833_003479 [Piccolia ochrophora]|nr:MAG: hypothetical protein M1833_003479 [Piccolia ochrophora]
MNNSQFRRLVLDTPVGQSGSSTPGKDSSASSRTDGGATPSASLGSKQRSAIPMTPRSISAITPSAFARQLAERNSSGDAPPAKRFRSSAAPKGAKLPTGYRDRTLDRVEVDDDDKAGRVQALEEAMKLGQLERATFEALRDEIVGGDVGTTHLVKGLDWKLLERVRRGEDVLTGGKVGEQEGEAATGESSEQKAVDVDDEFEQLEHQDVTPVQRPTSPPQKKGNMAPPPPPTQQKRSRDEILAQLKASRKASQLPPQQTLGPKFRNLSSQSHSYAKPRIERDASGREVLITVDEDGRVKRKVRRAAVGDGLADTETGSNGLLMPDKDVKPLGMDAPMPAASSHDEGEEDVDDSGGDIFDDVEGDYDPLAGLSPSDSDSSSETDAPPGKKEKTNADDEAPRASPPLPPDAAVPSQPALSSTTSPAMTAPRNYFNELPSSTTNTTDTSSANPLTDPTIVSALKKASSLAPARSPSPEDSAEAARRAKRKAMLEGHDRDAEDLDVGFGSSAVGDAEEEWIGASGGAGQKRKRGGKKRKGDGEKAEDVMRVVEGRKK